MSEYCVVAAEGARARIFTLEPAEVELGSGPNLVERKTLANSEHKAADAAIWTDTRRGAHREHQAGQRQRHVTGVPHHNYDEHRENNQERVDRAFARDIVTELDRLIAHDALRRVVLCAEKQMLGHLRPQISNHLSGNVELEEVPKDLVNFSPHELHEKLAKDGHLPPRKRGGT